MRGLVEVGLVAALLSAVCGCIEDGAPRGDLTDAGPDRDARAGNDPPHDTDGGKVSVGSRADAGADAGSARAPNRPPAKPAHEPDPTPKTDVPDELVGAWQSGSIDFIRWEAYVEGYYAGRNAVPSREAMIFREDGSAKFYRYEFAFTLYEKLIDCEGTVAFHEDGTFTFFPIQGRKRFYDSRYSEKNIDRELAAEELIDPTLAGTRAYSYDAESDALIITVPSSAPYRWYRKD